MFFSQKEGGDKALVIHPDFDGTGDSETEIVSLTEAAGAEVVRFVLAPIRQVHKNYFIGSGKLEQIQQLVEEHAADLIVVNTTLSPSQERNLEKFLQCRVIDRSRLILDIFSQRAQSHEGKLQVELAQLQYISTRLIRGWTHLERQKGGIGLRGPGESQLETDRRLLSNRVILLKKQLLQVRKQRQQNRQNRIRSETPALAIVGYTNAGKSTLFNTLTSGDTYAADQMFATLDTTSRQVLIPGVGESIFIDTVGFIQNLPHKLIEAFKATLEEVTLAHLLIHVVDASDIDYEKKIHAVQTVLTEIHAGTIDQIIVLNKTDRLQPYQKAVLPHSIQSHDANYPCIQLSALDSTTTQSLLTAIGQKLAHTWYSGWLKVRADQAGYLRAQLYRLASVDKEKYNEDGDLLLHVHLPQQYIDQYSALTPFTTSHN